MARPSITVTFKEATDKAYYELVRNYLRTAFWEAKISTDGNTVTAENLLPDRTVAEAKTAKDRIERMCPLDAIPSVTIKGFS